METDLSWARTRLLARRAEIVALSHGSAESRQPVALDQQSVGRVSRVDALQQQAMAQASEANRRHELRRIDAALKRLDEGDFGVCEACGEPIPERRLRIDPAVTECVTCAR